MKIVKGILTGIGVLAALLCALIILSATNPNITETLSSLVSGNGFPQKEEEESGPDLDASERETPAEESFETEPWENFDGDTGEAADTEEPSAGESSAEEPEDNSSSDRDDYYDNAAADRNDREQVRGTSGYEAPSELDVKVPEAVSGKGGYQPITEKSEELPDTDGEEYTSTLGYGETGDGLFFDAALYPYYQMLDQKGQHLYRQIFANATVMNAAFVPIEEVLVAELKNAVMAVYNDHPELFWLNTVFTCKYDRNKICAELELEFNMTQEELAAASTEFYNTTNSVLTQVEHLGTPYEKEKRLHDILLDKIEYEKGADMNQSAYSALVEGKSVCAGYARAYQYLMQRLGIPCYYCTGYAGTDHAWNIVALDDGYYNVDLTWDDTPGGEYDYFNRTDSDYADTHVRRDLSVNLPQCTGERYRSQ
ncbi:MAG: hypothetical protein NC302_02105 [Bacteroidales bacterium]|nr:hypothetical protein [Bacteroidales bacterium]MCM1415779.1 hypothetical protein [bacterium]MCM1422727.1 hypothetical protein [bacterium]